MEGNKQYAMRVCNFMARHSPQTVPIRQLPPPPTIPTPNVPLRHPSSESLKLSWVRMVQGKLFRWQLSQLGIARLRIVTGGIVFVEIVGVRIVRGRGVW